MGDSVVIFLFQHIIIFSFIFWFLTWGGGLFFNKKNHADKRKFYECGFTSLSDITIQININFALLCIFLILYDIEFNLMFPILFNITYISYIQFWFVLSFVVFIVFSLAYDWQMNALGWQY